MLEITSLIYIIYICLVFYYLSKIYGVPMAKKRILCILILINTYLIYLPVYILNFRYEGIVMALYFVALGTQIILVYKLNFISTLAALLCFTINYFGIRVLLIGLFTLDTSQQIDVFLNSIENRLKVTSLTFLILSPYILVSSRLLISKVVKYLFSDLSSLKLACILLGAVCINQFIALPTLYTNTEIPQFNAYYQITISLLSLVSFVIIMILVFIYSKLKQASVEYRNTTAEIQTEESTITRLEAEVRTDFFTGFYVRSVAVNTLQEFLKSKKYCYLVYLDLDGLKIVNDTLGHEEGDWYIQAVAKEIASVFRTETIARIGGDEFLIVGDDTEHLSITEKVSLCHDNVLKLKEQYNKAYDTSLSYGITEVDKKNNLSYEKLIDATDSKMYAFKKAQNKHRKTRS